MVELQHPRSQENPAAVCLLGLATVYTNGLVLTWKPFETRNDFRVLSVFQMLSDSVSCQIV